MNLAAFTMAVVFGVMLAEFRVSQRHERLLRARGAVEVRERQYPFMMAMYPLSFVAMGIEGALGGASLSSTFVAGALLFLASKGLKLWAIAALGERWSFRVFVLPGLPLVRSGPYRYIDHPNYLAVVGELAGAALMMRAIVAGPIALAVCGVLVWRRIQAETRALRASGFPADVAR